MSKRLKNIHPGEILLEEFLIPLEVSAYRLSKEILFPRRAFLRLLKAKDVLPQTQP